VREADGGVMWVRVRLESCYDKRMLVRDAGVCVCVCV
jgi:hypothetical protein